jgi:hypothetical protein
MFPEVLESNLAHTRLVEALLAAGGKADTRDAVSSRLSEF